MSCWHRVFLCCPRFISEPSNPSGGRESSPCQGKPLASASVPPGRLSDHRSSDGSENHHRLAKLRLFAPLRRDPCRKDPASGGRYGQVGVVTWWRSSFCCLPATLAIVLLTGSGVPAQTIGPTDNDLFATYCVGVAAAMADSSQKNLHAADECRRHQKPREACQMLNGGADLDALAMWLRSESEAMRLRSARYLTARGYFTNPAMIQDGLMMEPMRKSGIEDYPACNDAALTCMCAEPGKICGDTKECMPGGPKRPIICIKVDRCSRPDSLP
jgi:hypothetical protein